MDITSYNPDTALVAEDFQSLAEAYKQVFGTDPRYVFVYIPLTCTLGMKMLAQYLPLYLECMSTLATTVWNGKYYAADITKCGTTEKFINYHTQAVTYAIVDYKRYLEKSEINICGFVDACANERGPGSLAYDYPAFNDPRHYQLENLHDLYKTEYVQYLLDAPKYHFNIFYVHALLPSDNMDTYLRIPGLDFGTYLINMGRMTQPMDITSRPIPDSVDDKYNLAIIQLTTGDLYKLSDATINLLVEGESYFQQRSHALASTPLFSRGAIGKDMQAYLFSMLINDHKHLLLIYANDGAEPIGYLEYISKPDRPVMLHKVYFKRGLRRKGCGTQIIQQWLREVALSMKSYPCTLLSVYGNEKELINFYNRFGYEIYSLILFHRGTDEELKKIVV